MSEPGYHEGKDALVKRLHLIEGQVRGIERMVEDDRYCIDVLTQVGAVKTALESLAFELLTDHVSHCVAGALETGDPRARAYYRRLDRESRVIAEFSPYKYGYAPVPFSFDLSYNYYPRAYERPGPTVQIRRLRDCEQASGPPLIRIPKAREPEPFS